MLTLTLPIIVRNTEEEGISSFWVPNVIDLGPRQSKFGAKLFRRRRDAERAQRNQRAGEKKGLAPRTGQRVRANLVNRRGELKKRLYGYLSEQVRAGTWRETNTSWWDKKIEELAEKMKDCGWSDNDLRVDNCGITHDGRFVCIDWCPVSTYYTPKKRGCKNR